MTDLERELLSALEHLENEHAARHSEWERAFERLLTMFQQTQQDNMRLHEQVTRLSVQVEGLSASVGRWTPEVKKR